MIRKNTERNVEFKENHLGGNGSLSIRHLLNGPGELQDKGRVFAHTTLQPGASIGYHIHDGESETYYIYSGSAEFNDNGKTVALQAGDVAFTGSGEGHGIKNIGDGPLELIALILYR